MHVLVICNGYKPLLHCRTRLCQEPCPKKHHVLCRDALLLKVCLHCCAGQPSVCRGLCGVHVLPCTGHHLQGESLCSIQATPRRPVFGPVCGQFLWLSLPSVLHFPAAASDVKPQRHLFATAAELPAPRQVAASHLLTKSINLLEPSKTVGHADFSHVMCTLCVCFLNKIIASDT